MSALDEISATMAQLASDGVPESIALLTIARRCIDAASAQVPTTMHIDAGIVRVRLGRISRELIENRDNLDRILHDITKGR